MSLSVEQLNFSYDGVVPVLQDLSFSVVQGEIFCLLGPSGCGKTTLIKLLAGLLTPTKGVISQGFKCQKSFLFQEPRLIPQMTVLENLRFTCPPNAASFETIEKLLKAVSLEKVMHYFPDELSGGMQQRLSVVRAFLHPSDLMLLDEPFKSLDVKIKLNVMDTFLSLWRQSPKTVMMITHDVLDAALLADHVLVLTEKPTVIQALIKNPVAREKRQLGEPQVGVFEQELYKALMAEV